MNSNTYFCSVCGAPIKRKQKQSAVVQRTNIITESVCENDHICPSCCKLAVQSYNQYKGSVASEIEVTEHTKHSYNGECSTNGDNNECLMCHTSLYNRQSLLIIKSDPTELDQLMFNLIRDIIVPQTKIGSEDKVCSKCWFKIRRTAIDLQQINKLEPNGIGDEKQSVENTSDTRSDLVDSGGLLVVTENCHSEEIEDQEKIECHYDNDDPLIDDFKDNSDDPDFTVNYLTNNRMQVKYQHDPKVSAEILLPNYKRCTNTSRHCAFWGCKNPERLCIPIEIRQKMLRDNKFYLPKSARICQQHFQSNDCFGLHSTSLTANIQLKFNARHIEDMFSMVQIKKSTDKDFNHILNYNDNFIEHLLGVKRKFITSILAKEPKIENTRNGLNGLLGLILKHENGSPDTKIKTLLNISRPRLQRAMYKVKKILLKSMVTKEFGIEYLL